MSQEEVEHMLARIANHDPTAKLPDNEYYIITSAIEGSKSGCHLQITMTWETYATGAFTIPEDISEVDHIIAQNGYVDVYLTSTPVSEPTVTTWTLKINNTEVLINYCSFDGDITARLYFDEETTAGTYIVDVDGKTDSFVVS